MDARVVQGIALLGFGTLFGLTQRALDRRHRRIQSQRVQAREPVDLPSVLDEVDEPEPTDIVYDQRLPCVASPMGPTDEAEGCIHPKDIEPQGFEDVPFSRGIAQPAWPVLTNHPRKLQVSYVDVRDKWHGKWGREFGASRKSTEDGDVTKRHHAGVDLFGNEGDTVVAMEDGEVIGIFKFHHGSWAIYVLNDTGDVINYGEVAKNSWGPFGIQVGSRVRRGQKIARLGKMLTDTMLHVEAYAVQDVDQLIDDIRHERMRWIKGDPYPENLLDPTHYLIDAQLTVLGQS